MQVASSLFQCCVNCMFGGIQIAQGSKIGGTIVVEVRRSECREICLCHIELGLCRGKLVFVVVEKRVELGLLASRSVIYSLLNTRAKIPQFDADVDRYIEVESTAVAWKYNRKNAELEEDVNYILSRQLRIGLRIEFGLQGSQAALVGAYIRLQDISLVTGDEMVILSCGDLPTQGC